MTLIPEPTYAEPLPLLPEMDKAAPYPVEALGPVLGEAAKAIASIVKVPPAMAAQSVLSAAAMAAQPHGDAVRDGQVIPLSLFMLTVAESGDRKSAADKLALTAHRQYQRDLMEQYKADRKEYRDANDVYQKARAAILDRAKTDPHAAKAEIGQLEEPIEPPSPFILAEEPTLEGLQKSLLRGHASQGLFSDEGGQFFGGHASKPENMLKTVAGLSKLWDAAPITRTRASEGESDFRHGCRLSAHLMIQPIVATDVLSNPTMKGQGFLPRFLVAWPTSLAGTRRYESADPTTDPRLGRYWQRMAALLALEPFKSEAGELTPSALHMGKQAKDVWIKEHDRFEIELGQGGDLEDIKPTAAKAAENLLRIAGVFAIVEQSSSISAPLAERAAILMRWYVTEALRLAQPIKIDPQLRNADRLAHWLINKQWFNFDARRLQREGPSFTRKAATERDRLLALLVSHHWLSTLDGKQFTLNPAAVATSATFATKPATPSPETCDTFATSCDNTETAAHLSQPVATLSQPSTPDNTGLVADVANVADTQRYGGVL